MKNILNLILMLVVMATTLFPQTTHWIPTEQGKIVALNIPITLGKAATNYSGDISLDGYLPFDSTSFIPILWQANDTVQVTITLEVQNSVRGQGYASSYSGSWQTAATLATSHANAGNDTLYVMNVFQRGTIQSGVLNAVSMGGKIGDKARIKVVFGNPTTVGNGGQFRLWVHLRKR